ncbi:MAG: potassium transporter Kup [Nocardioidaceae bacterium]|nr:potassium transporter Kup [Nocardioidaceae bacterium]
MPPSSRHPAVLVVGALGVVFGDIGTSPLYAFRAILGEGDPRDPVMVLGMCSLVIWSLLLVVTALYVGLLLREDNDGEGGLLALLALLRRSHLQGRRLRWAVLLAMAGAAMFLGDSVITPAISVLSASEGLTVASPAFEPWVVPVALVLLAGVFVLQRIGSGAIGRFYGPVMVVWFAILAVFGVVALAGNLTALRALEPWTAARFVVADPAVAFLCLGSVVLAVTGAEALYADLGHFGRSAITRSWLVVVLPALVVAYLGECAYVLEHPSAAAEPFYAVVPEWARIPVLVVATLATVIASEAVIAGGFTVLHQAGGLGLLPFLRTRHTSARQGGQIYVPSANWTMAVAVLGVVLLFRSSEKLASAYGVAVSVTIMVTISLYLLLTRARRADGDRWRTAAGFAMLLVMAWFVAAAVPKVPSGGWLPTGIGIVLLLVMWSWVSGRHDLQAALRGEEVPVSDLLDRASGDGTRALPGAGVYLTDRADVAPLALTALVERWQTMPTTTVLLSWRVEDSPSAPAHEAAATVRRFDGPVGRVLAVDAVLGYQERLDVEHVLGEARRQEPEMCEALDLDQATYFVSDEIPRPGGRWPVRWRHRLFQLVDRLSTDRVEQLALPRDRTVVLGREVRL